MTGACLALDEFLDGPAKATCVIGIDGLEDEQKGAGFKEEDGTDKGGYATAVVDLSREL